MSDDSDIVEVMRLAKLAGVTVHVRGSDERPVIEFRDKWTRKVVGGIELKRRLKERARGDGDQPRALPFSVSG